MKFVKLEVSAVLIRYQIMKFVYSVVLFQRRVNQR